MSEAKSVYVPLTDGQLRAIGLVSFHWSMLQYILQHAIWALIPCAESNGRAVTTEVNDITRCYIARTLARQMLSEKKFEEFSQYIKTYDDLRIQRNAAIHNEWAGDQGDLAKGYKPTAKGEFKMNTSFWSEADLKSLADEIEELTVEMVNFLGREFGWLSS